MFVAAMLATRAMAASGESAAKPPLAIAGGATAVVAEPEGTQPLPGSDGRLSLSLARADEGRLAVAVLEGKTALAPPVTLQEGSSTAFTLDGYTYALSYTGIQQDGKAGFVLAEGAPAGHAFGEQEQIDRLIAVASTMQGVRFVRSGKEYTAADAAALLRKKRRIAGDRLNTAKDFITHIASRSYLTGKPYMLRFPSGRTVPAGDFLTELLAKMTGADEADGR